MNILQNRRIIIDYWVWEPLSKEAKEDEDNVLKIKHEGRLLPHCGYVTIRFEEGNTVEPHKFIPDPKPAS